MKKLITAIVLLTVLTLMLAGCGNSSKETELKFTNEEYFVITLDKSNNMIIEKYIGPDTEVVIPAGIKDYKIVAIADNAFAENTNITKVVIPSGIVSIGNEAFLGCTSLKSVTLSDTVESIGRTAFENCSALSTVNLPSSLKPIGVSAFKGTTSLKSIDFPDSEIVMGGSAFSDSGIESVTIPKSLKHAPDEDPEQGWWFFCCANLKKVTYGDGVTEVNLTDFCGTGGGSVHDYCYMMVSDVYIPESAVSFIGELSNAEFGSVHVKQGSEADSYFEKAKNNSRFVRHIKNGEASYSAFTGELIYE